MLLRFHGSTLNQKHLDQIVDTLKKGGVIIMPTDTVYAFTCDIHSSKAFDEICRLKGMKPEKANFSFICHDLSNISEFTKPYSTEIFRLMKNTLPGPFTYILNANNNVPAIFKSNKKTIGIRIPDNDIARAIVAKLGNPVMVTSVHDDHDEIMDYITDPEEIDARLGDKVDLVIDGGPGTLDPSTVIDCTSNEPVVVREGKGIIP